jgi:enediyne biosynthesis protein E3
MACALLDTLPLPGRGRFARLLSGPGAHEPFLLHAGAGWAYARLRRRSWPITAFDPLLRWLPYDGYGFHQAFFAGDRVHRVSGARGWSPYAHRAFHQGVGRALWFSCGADPERIATTAATFPAGFATDLWSGVGLAAAYAGGAPDGTLPALVALSGMSAPALAQGAIAATAARVTASNTNVDTERACTELCALTVDEAFELYETSLDGLEPRVDPMAYETWRTRIQHHFRKVDR